MVFLRFLRDDAQQISLIQRQPCWRGALQKSSNPATWISENISLPLPNIVAHANPFVHRTIGELIRGSADFPAKFRNRLKARDAPRRWRQSMDVEKRAEAIAKSEEGRREKKKRIRTLKKIVEPR